jgi:methylmalonyl-CoA decarboxylase subunit alpha
MSNLDTLLEKRTAQLREIRQKISLGGGEEKLAKQHAKGKLSGRERLDYLLDPGSFVEIQPLLGHVDGLSSEGIVCGYGTIDGRHVCVYSQDPTVMGGSMGQIHLLKMAQTVERALEMQVPFIGLHDSPGARVGKLDESRALTAGVYDQTVFFANTQASGVVPQISGILGSCAGVAVYSPALTDFIFMVDKTSHMCITGPRVVKTSVGEDISLEDLGGAKVHCQKSGAADLRTATEKDCLDSIKKLLSFLPSNHNEAPPVKETGDDPDRTDDEIGGIVPENPYTPYDMHKVVARLVDNGDFFEVKPEFAGEIITCFARLDGRTVGIVANNPMVLAGAMTANSSDKQARFLRFCNCYHIPIVMLIDTPAFLPGSHSEHAGIIRRGAKVIYALCEGTVPRISVVLRKSYGGGNFGMGNAPGFKADFNFFWPTVEIGVMGAEQSVALMYAEEIKKAEDPEAFVKKKVTEYREKFANPLFDASFNIMNHDTIEPGDTRRMLIKALRLLRNKKVRRLPKVSGNIPL